MSDTPVTPVTPNLSPIRIYVLWHSDMDKSEDPALKNRGITLARRIYHWFRMENMEGIPVYFRSAAEPGGDVPPPVDDDNDVRNYLITLVDANMVASPSWRAYVSDLASRDKTDGSQKNSDTTNQTEGSRRVASARSAEYRFLPVAMESVAYNMPDRIRTLNFIRHIPRGAQAPDDLELLAKITEVLCRDLRHWLSRETNGRKENRPPGSLSRTPGKIKIFLSHAKADDTQEAAAIKEYIQRETQCEAFFDETDIASGHDFAKILENAITEESAGLIVLQGDNYADRPWCRKEIRDFLAPLPDPLAKGMRHEQYAVAPVVVVQTMKGRQIARTIPELGYSPSVLWQANRADAARFVVTTLLREICFGLFYRALARRVALLEQDTATISIYLNRSPDPVMINRIVAARTVRADNRLRGKKTERLEFVHPGYGLSKMEYEGLTTAFPTYEFRSFLGITHSTNSGPLDLRGRIIALSAGNPGDILSLGLWEEHIQEILVRLLRPLLQAQASLLYGGGMPKSFRPERPWDESINFTAVLLQLLLSDRDTGQGHLDPPRLYVPVPCQKRSTINASIVAQWSDVCTFVHVTPEDSGISREELVASAPIKPDDESRKYLTDAEKRKQDEEFVEKSASFAESQCALEARAYSAMRRKICDTKRPLTCQLPDRPDPKVPESNVRTINPFVHILIGGKPTEFSGIMPGIFEEALYAFDAGKPVFIIAEYGGAAATLAKWLLAPPETCPKELSPEYYEGDKTEQPKTTYQKMLAGFELLPANGPQLLAPAAAFEQLWGHIVSTRNSGGLAALLNNGLDDNGNRELLQARSSGDICRGVWKGIGRLCETDNWAMPTPRCHETSNTQVPIVVCDDLKSSPERNYFSSGSAHLHPIDQGGGEIN